MGVHGQELEYGFPSPVTEERANAIADFITERESKLVREARLDQIMKDFLQTDICTDIDEAILIDIRKSQEEDVLNQQRNEEDA